MYSNFSSLLCSYFHQTPSHLHRPDWPRLYELGHKHNILPILYESARSLPEFQTAPASVQQKFLNTAVSQIVNQQTRTETFLCVYRALTDAGLRPLILKGLVCRLLYPQPDCRPSSDEDLWIAPSDFSLCDSVLRQCGYTCVTPQVSPEVLKTIQTVNYENGILTLEIHINPFGTKSATHRAMNRIFAGALDHPMAFSLNGQTLWTLSPTRHYLFLLVHLYKHFLSAGTGIRQLLDLCLFDTAYASRINRTVVWQAVRALHLTDFYGSLLKIGRTFLGFSDLAADSPLPQRKNLDERPLLAEMMDAGCFGVQDESRRYSSAFTQATLHGTGLFSILFPPLGQLRSTSQALDRHPWLLPLFWIKRWKRIAFRILDDQFSLGGSLNTGLSRIRVFRRYGIRPIRKHGSRLPALWRKKEDTP